VGEAVALPTGAAGVTVKSSLLGVGSGEDFEAGFDCPAAETAKAIRPTKTIDAIRRKYLNA